MRHAAAGNALMLKMATSASPLSRSHTYAAQPAAVGMSGQHSPFVAVTDYVADGPARCSVCLDDPECHSTPEGNTERIHQLNTPHPRLEG